MGRSAYGLRGLMVAAMAVLLSASTAAAQAISGRVTSQDGTPIVGAQIVVTNLTTSAVTGGLSGQDGRYTVGSLRPNVPYRVEVQMIGYGTGKVDEVRLNVGETRTLDFSLGAEAISVAAIEVFSERAVDRRTPVAYSNVDKTQIERQLASRDIPMVLNTTPSVYATMQGGGAGDARVNVRGFTQRNLGVMINGVPVNDMENGWVYWSNWDGVGDATSSIQMQRGLSAVNLATPSIGGTLNIITDPAAMGRRLMVKQEFGDDGFLKTTGSLSSGMINDKFSFMLAGVRKVGDGVIRGTWTDAWAYYGAASWIINPSNRLELYAIGAPQKHGQQVFKQNIATYSHELAQDMAGYDPGALTKFPENPDGREYNQNWDPVNVSYDGKQYYAGSIQNRQDSGFLNERVNYFHKPQINLNWYSQINRDLLWSTVAYYSGGKGGGSGTFGSLLYNTAGPNNVRWAVDWDATINRNRANVQADGRALALGFLRGSRNNQWTIGAISKMKAQVSPELTVEFGVDWRTAEIEHYRDVVDLLGGDYYLCTSSRSCSSDFNPSYEVGLGDIIDYNNTNNVDWLGGFVQGEYVKDNVSTYGMVGLSTIKYALTDFFRDAGNGQPLELKSDRIGGMQVKGGGLINVTNEVGLFANAGYVAKVPIFDDVISDVNAILNTDPKNEKFTSLEAGLQYRGLDRPITFKANLYYTTWKDRATTERFFDASGEDFYVTLTGLDQRHMGVEFEAAWQPSDALRFDGAASIGNWKYTNDVNGSYSPEGSTDVFEYEFFISDLKVGDAPQTQFSYGAMVFPTEGLYVQAVGRTYSNYYADFNPFDRTDENDRAQSWQIPGYTLFDLHAGYDLNLPQLGSRVKLFANVFNLFDKLYIQDALDNSSFNGFDSDHDADDAEVFIGLPRTFTLGLQISR